MRASPSSRHPAARPHHPHHPRPTIAGYHLLDFIAESWSCARYRAVLLATRAEVELRVLVPPAAEVPEFARRFVEAAQRVRSLHHPNLLACHDAGRTPGIAYQVCEEAGGDLAALRRSAGGRLDEKEALRIAVDCARALEALHHDGVIHGDIGPASVYAVAAAPARLGVPGLSASLLATTPERRLALYRERGGALSPETIVGQREPDVAGDIYAVSALLFLMVVGHPPTQARSLAELAAFAADAGSPDPERPGTRLSPPLVSVLRKGMQRDPGARYASAALLREDLERLLFDFSPIHSRALTETAAPARRRTSMILQAAQQATVAAAQPAAVEAAPPAADQASEPVERPVAAPRRRLPATAIAGLAVAAAIVATVWIAQRRTVVAAPPPFPAAVAALPAPDAVAAETTRAPIAPPELKPPRWAMTSGVDAAGRWAAVEVTGHRLRFRHCDHGSAALGSPVDEVGRHADENAIVVRITRGFWLAETETPQACYQALMAANPSSFHGDDLPVDSVTWDEARAFCGALSARTGASVRLPSEAEWEYACRAGDALPFPEAGASAVCWSRETSGPSSHPVGALGANRWGLHDMQGNVLEWCDDAYAPYPTLPVDDWRGAGGSLRSARGGAWCSAAADCRSAARAKYLQGARYFFLGFRVLIEDG